MKQRLLRILSISSVLFVAIAIISNSGGPSGDNTGSPNDSNQDACTQSGCHSQFTLNSGTGQVTSNAPASYYPGNQYSITIQVSQPSPTPGRYGFQGVFLNNSNQQAGSLTAGTGSSVNTSGIDNIRHNSTFNSTGTWTFTWTAPSSPEQVTFYYAGNAANNNGTTTGDYIYTNSDVISALNLITFTEDSTATSCYNTCDGEVSMSNITGGAGAPYSFDWNTGDTTATVTGLCSGTYTVTVTDGGGNTETAEMTVESPPTINTATNANPATCAFGDGDALVSASGGVGNFTYLWSNGVTTDFAMNLPAGTYYVTVTDGTGCTAVDSATVQSGASGLQGVTQSAPEHCAQADGTASILMFTGNQPFTYEWPNGSQSPISTGLEAGTYTVTVTDSIGCVQPFTVLVDEVFAVIDTNATALTHVQCYGGNNGSINVVMAEGTSPFHFTWEGLPNDSLALISSLPSDTYAVTVTDSAGCQDSASFIIEGPDEIILDSAGMTPDAFRCNGSLTAYPSGGTPPYSYSWSDTSNQTTQTATGLCSGVVYSVSVTDAHNCLAIFSGLMVMHADGISERASGTISVRPNPASEAVSVSLTSGTIEAIHLRDIHGKRVRSLEGQPPSAEWVVPLSDLSPGVYFLLVTTGAETEITPLVIKR